MSEKLITYYLNGPIGDNENNRNERRKQREEETDDLTDENRLKSKITDDFQRSSDQFSSQLIEDRRKYHRNQQSMTIDVGEDSSRFEYFQPGFAQQGVPSVFLVGPSRTRPALSNGIIKSTIP